MLDLYVTKAFSPVAELRLVAKNVLSVDKIEDKTTYTAAGTVKSANGRPSAPSPLFT